MMDIYFAGTSSGGDVDDVLGIIPARLDTYNRYRSVRASVDLYLRRTEKLRRAGCRLFFIDSGAFSVWTKGEEVDLRQYGKFLLRVQDSVDLIASLDVIPGRPHSTPTEDERESAARISHQNYESLVAMGVDLEKLVPIFHQWEDFCWLEAMVEGPAPYIGISPANDVGTPGRLQWLRICESIVRGKKKCHGFAVTSIRLMSNFPWTSVDSASWTLAGGLGIIFCPLVCADGTYDFLRGGSVHVSSRDGRPLPTGMLPDHLEAYVNQYGETLGSVRCHHLGRRKINMHYFLEAQKAINALPQQTKWKEEFF